MDATVTGIAPTPADAELHQDPLGPILTRLDRIESVLNALVRQSPAQESFSTQELAELLNKAEFTVREWCRLGRINARKKRNGRGAHPEWVIARDELERFRREGLLPRR